MAKETIIRRRDTHIDSLMERLKEERVRRVVEPVITGEDVSLDELSDDVRYVLDLGLLKQDRGALVPSNPIYAEVILRFLSWDTQQAMLRSIPDAPWAKPGGLDMAGLMAAFQAFWRENPGSWKGAYGYREAGPHLVMTAFFQRVLNGGGRLTREMALGSGRLDLGIEFHGSRYAVEIRLKTAYRPEASLAQFAKYLDALGLAEGWMPIFDTEAGKPREERLYARDVAVSGKAIHLVGL